MKSIVRVPSDVLTTPAQEVTSFDAKLTKLIEEMNMVLVGADKPKGVGLAATQIGVTARVFLTRPTKESKTRVFINPVITSSSEEVTDGVPERENKFEGCLSIPRIWGMVRRAKSLRLRYQDERGKFHEEDFTGFLATIVQHETDHLNGILFTRRVLEQKGKLYEAVKDKDGKEVLEQIRI